MKCTTCGHMIYESDLTLAKCENEIVHLPTGVTIRCMRESTNIYSIANGYDIRLCEDCRQGERSLRERAIKVAFLSDPILNGHTPCAECGTTTAEFLCKKCWRELAAMEPDEEPNNEEEK